MNNFSKRSIDNLKGVRSPLTIIAYEVLKEIDITVISGVRTAEEQNILYNKGYSQLDGYTKLSKHQSGDAIDIVPYPIDWNDKDRFKSMGKIIKRVAKKLDIDIIWGGDWKSFVDFPHIQLKLS